LLGNYLIGGINGRFNTLAEAVNMLECGGVETAVKFTLAPGAGPFNESVSLNPVAGASAVNTITFSGGSTSEKVTSTGSYTFRLNGADHIILEDLTIENLHATNGTNVLFVNQADHNIIRNNYFPLKSSVSTANPFVGVVIGTTAFSGTPNNGSFNQIVNNEFDGGLAAVVMRAANGGLDQENTVSGNIISNANLQGVVSVYQKMPFIRNNQIDFIAGTTSSTGIQSENNDNFEFSGNVIRNYRSRGIYITNGNNISGGVNSRAKIVNNMLISASGTFGDGISFGSNSSFIDIFHNSVSVNGGSGDGMSIFSGNSISVKNNSFAVFNPSGSFNRAFYGGANVTYSGFDNNNFFITGGGAVVRVNNVDLGQANFAGYGGFNTNSHFGDPGYLDLTSDLHAITTQLDNKGDNSVGVTTDIDGQPRPALTGGQVDIGADEFIIYPTDIAITGLIAPSQNGRVLTSKSLSASQDITVRVTNSGGTAIANVPVFYNINGVTSAQETVAGPIAPGASTNFTFAAKADLSA
ncbi:MAG TPA: right-handed parallel beta-helix repeat-containing protein, partial [Adhaeribacter sp.]|nr:right-handed parallel beta-helix repeat-containing protein [Adhaeribacter sp.]